MKEKIWDTSYFLVYALFQKRMWNWILLHKDTGPVGLSEPIFSLAGCQAPIDKFSWLLRHPWHPYCRVPALLSCKIGKVFLSLFPLQKPSQTFLVILQGSENLILFTLRFYTWIIILTICVARKLARPAIGYSVKITYIGTYILTCKHVN